MLDLAVVRQIAEVVGGLRHRFDAHEIDRCAVPDVPLDPVDDRLRGCEIARGEHHQLPLAVATEGEHLAVVADLIDTGVGARVRGKHQTLIDGDSETISHGFQ